MILIRLFLLFFRIGLFSFGGGYAMLPLIYQGAGELTGMGAEEFFPPCSLSQVTPVPWQSMRLLMLAINAPVSPEPPWLPSEWCCLPYFLSI